MQGGDVYRVLKQIGATHLHHANSVTTSCTFLEVGGLASRGFVESQGLNQTGQQSDAIDKEYGIWDCVFLDHVDIHDRGGRVKGPNQYGPVLFVLDLDFLLKLPAGTEILVTRKNPVHWYKGQPASERYFETVQELEPDIKFGNFDKMLVISTPSKKLDFPNRRARIILDDPQTKVLSGENAYTCAETRLKAAAAAGGVDVHIEPRQCRSGCICIQKYAAKKIDFWFA